MQKLVPIGEAAKFLNVSIDTIRRYDKMGILHSQRPGGKVRFFDLEELKAVKVSKPKILVTNPKTDIVLAAHFHKKTFKIGLFFIRIIVLTLTILTILFLLFPEKMARLLTSFM